MKGDSIAEFGGASIDSDHAKLRCTLTTEDVDGLESS